MNPSHSPGCHGMYGMHGSNSDKGWQVASTMNQRSNPTRSTWVMQQAYQKFVRVSTQKWLHQTCPILKATVETAAATKRSCANVAMNTPDFKLRKSSLEAGNAIHNVLLRNSVDGSIKTWFLKTLPRHPLEGLICPRSKAKSPIRSLIEIRTCFKYMWLRRKGFWCLFSWDTWSMPVTEGIV